jgi:nitroreductase / dihydropteridine reductase
MSFLTQLSWRYATKKFDTEKKVSQEELSKIMEAIKMTPTSFGLQPFHVVLVENAELRNQIKTASWEQTQVTEASHLLVFCARTDVSPRIDTYFDMASGGSSEIRLTMKGYEDMMKGFASNMDEEKLKVWAGKQAYIALGFAMAAATEISVDSCPMEGFDSSAVKNILNLPENIYPAVLLPIGFRAGDDVIRPKVRFNDLFETK